MIRTHKPWHGPLMALTMGFCAWLPPVAAANETAAADSPKKIYDEYSRDFSVPAVPAATLLGVDKSKIVEVASTAKLSGTFTAARAAESSGSPFGIDLSPVQLLADRKGAVVDGNYASDQVQRLLVRTRISLATATQGNSHMTAWGIHTRPFDLRDPFVDKSLESCFVGFSRGFSEHRKSAPTFQQLPAKFDPTEAERLKLALLPHYKRQGVSEVPASVLLEIDQAVSAPDPVAAAKKLYALLGVMDTSKYEAEDQALKATYKNCDTAARSQLAKRSYLAIGYSQGGATAVDTTKPLDVRPGKSLWMTFVYGFEGMGNIFGGENKWRDTSGSDKWRAAGTNDQTLLEKNARLTLFLSHNRDSSKLVSGVDTSTAGNVVGLGFDYADGDKRRWSAQVARAQLGGTTERTTVLGADFKVQDNVWLGASWGRRVVSKADAGTEVKAQLKWAFSDSSWLSP